MYLCIEEIVKEIAKSKQFFLRARSLAVTVQYKATDHLYPHKPGQVTQLVADRSGKPFSSHNHTQAWRLFKVRPRHGVKQPENTDKDYCIYHVAHRDYTYSDKWVDRLVDEIADDQKFAAIKAVKLRRRRLRFASELQADVVTLRAEIRNPAPFASSSISDA